ncbi:hypothetical protein TYRP_010349 [Tyrophagus putrescentiae]|nr:hypothetical protein TYRP_010349 [Tyrophagus putrescentiae]
MDFEAAARSRTEPISSLATLKRGKFSLPLKVIEATSASTLAFSAATCRRRACSRPPTPSTVACTTTEAPSVIAFTSRPTLMAPPSAATLARPRAASRARAERAAPCWARTRSASARCSPSAQSAARARPSASTCSAVTYLPLDQLRRGGQILSRLLEVRRQAFFALLKGFGHLLQLVLLQKPLADLLLATFDLFLLLFFFHLLFNLLEKAAQFAGHGGGVFAHHGKSGLFFFGVRLNLYKLHRTFFTSSFSVGADDDGKGVGNEDGSTGLLHFVHFRLQNFFFFGAGHLRLLWLHILLLNFFFLFLLLRLLPGPALPEVVELPRHRPLLLHLVIELADDALGALLLLLSSHGLHNLPVARLGVELRPGGAEVGVANGGGQVRHPPAAGGAGVVLTGEVGEVLQLAQGKVAGGAAILFLFLLLLLRQHNKALPPREVKDVLIAVGHLLVNDHLTGKGRRAAAALGKIFGGGGGGGNFTAFFFTTTTSTFKVEALLHHNHRQLDRLWALLPLSLLLADHLRQHPPQVGELQLVQVGKTRPPYAVSEEDQVGGQAPLVVGAVLRQQLAHHGVHVQDGGGRRLNAHRRGVLCKVGGVARADGSADGDVQRMSPLREGHLMGDHAHKHNLRLLLVLLLLCPSKPGRQVGGVCGLCEVLRRIDRDLVDPAQLGVHLQEEVVEVGIGRPLDVVGVEAAGDDAQAVVHALLDQIVDGCGVGDALVGFEKEGEKER